MITETIGYAILIGIGLFLALVISLIIKAETKWLGIKKTSDWFSTAGRTVKTGLLASSIVSAWVWAATLLQSSTVAYKFGISGPFWYAAGATIPLIFFAILAMHLKLKIPNATTFPQIIYQRYGKSSHKVFLSFALLTNTIVTSMLILGGAAVMHQVTGINITIAALLLPMGIIIYTFFGGLRATFLADYINVVILFVGVLIFVSAVYFVNPEIGGISGMYQKLQNSSVLKPIDGNVSGSLLTMASIGGLVFGIINIVGNLGTVFVDQSYWQRAIAAKEKVGGRAFLTGGLVWFAIPFGLATALGLAAVGLGINVSQNELDSGLVAPLSAIHLLGDFGGILILTMLFTAVTSAGSAQLIAVSSLVTHDIYKTYKNPKASGPQLYSFTRKMILTFGSLMGILGVVLFKLQFSLQYLYLVMGVLIGSAVGPIALALLWPKTNRKAATLGAIVGLACGVTSWLYTSWLWYGSISLQATSHDMPLLIGNIFSIMVGIAITVFGSIIKPEQFRFDKTQTQYEINIKKEIFSEYKNIRKYAIITPLVLVAFWPMSLYLSGIVFSEIAFHIWVILSVAWAIGAAFVGIALPIIESRTGIAKIIKNSIISLVFSGIVGFSILSYVTISTTNVKMEYVDIYIYSMIGVLASFGVVVIMLNKRLKRLVDIQTQELINERNNLEEIVAKKTDQLIQKEKLATIGQLSARIAHDLRNPLSVLQSTLEIIQLKNKNQDEKTKEQYQRMERAVERMAHQIEDVLDYVRIGRIKTEKCSIFEVISQAVERLSLPKTIDTKISVSDIVIECDRIKIDALITNLILNSAQAIENNGKIMVRTIEKGKNIIIEVEDSGPEIPQTTLQRMFTPLFTTKQNGTGLGLASCKTIVEQHAGTISVKTKPTIFTITLPKLQTIENELISE